MPQVRVTRRYRFSASHRLHSPVLDDARNREVYGKCNNPHGHGHDYTLEVSMKGELDAATGRLAPLSHLDSLVESTVLKDLRWRNLNEDVEEFTAIVPTTENLARVIAARLASAWHVAFAGRDVQFEKLRIYETKNNIFECVSPLRETAGEPRVGESELEEVQ